MDSFGPSANAMEADEMDLGTQRVGLALSDSQEILPYASEAMEIDDTSTNLHRATLSDILQTDLAIKESFGKLQRANACLKDDPHLSDLSSTRTSPS
jgi:hypothetical protein